jgi:hypothetical protein
MAIRCFSDMSIVVTSRLHDQIFQLGFDLNVSLMTFCFCFAVRIG